MNFPSGLVEFGRERAFGRGRARPRTSANAIAVCASMSGYCDPWPGNRNATFPAVFAASRRSRCRAGRSCVRSLPASPGLSSAAVELLLEVFERERDHGESRLAVTRAARLPHVPRRGRPAPGSRRRRARRGTSSRRRVARPRPDAARRTVPPASGAAPALGRFR